MHSRNSDGRMASQVGKTRPKRYSTKRRAERKHVDPLAFTWPNIALADTEAAFLWLERAYEAKSSWMIFLMVHKIYEPLRSDPRYHNLLRRLGLEEGAGSCPADED